MKTDSHIRTFIKTVCYRLLGSLSTVLIVLIFTGQFNIAIKTGILEMIMKLILYYGYERFWDWISWGKEK